MHDYKQNKRIFFLQYGSFRVESADQFCRTFCHNLAIGKQMVKLLNGYLKIEKEKKMLLVPVLKKRGEHKRRK